MKVRGFQLDIEWENKSANFTKVRAMLASDPPAPDTLLILPEMFATGFSMNVADIAEAQPSETEQFLTDLAKEYRIAILAGLARFGSEGRGRNEAFFVKPDGSIKANYCKIKPFSYGEENQHFEAGRSITLFEWGGLKIAPFICYDLRFPELFRAAVREGAQAFMVIANWPQARTAHWTNLLQARAIENQAYVVGINRAGSDPKLNYDGRSLIIDPLGEILVDAGNEEKAIEAELVPEVVNAWREKFPALKDMRGDMQNPVS